MLKEKGAKYAKGKSICDLPPHARFMLDSLNGEKRVALGYLLVPEAFRLIERLGVRIMAFYEA